MIKLLEEQFANLTMGLVDESLIEIKKLLKHAHIADELRYESAHYLAQLGFVNEAIEIVEELVQIHPHENELVVFLAELLTGNNEEDKALDLLASIQPDEEEFVRATILLADIYLIQGLYEVAVHKLKEALAYYPDESLLYIALGEVFYEEQNYQLALLNFLRGEQEAYDKLANCYAHLGRFEEALAMYEKALNVAADPELLFGHAFVASQLEEWLIATNSFEQLLEQDPYFTSAYPLLVEAYVKLGQYEKALSFAELGLTYDEVNPQLFYLKGDILLRQEMTKEAKQLFEQTLAVDEAYTIALEKLLYISIEEEDWSSSLTLVKKMLKHSLGNADLFLQQDYAYEGLEKWKEAEQSYREALKYDRENVEALNRLASLLRAEGYTEEAIQLWNQSLSLNPDQWEVNDLLYQMELER